MLRTEHSTIYTSGYNFSKGIGGIDDEQPVALTWHFVVFPCKIDSGEQDLPINILSQLIANLALAKAKDPDEDFTSH